MRLSEFCKTLEVGALSDVVDPFRTNFEKLEFNLHKTYAALFHPL